MPDTATLAPREFVCLPRSITVNADSSFSFWERSIIEQSLANLRRYNITATLTPGEADVYLRRWTFHCDSMLLGTYVAETDFIYIDPRCSGSTTQFRAVIVHEIGHWLGMRHICRVDRKTSDACSPVGFGDAVMNPTLNLDQSPIPGALDLAEYRRVCWIRSRTW
jgi:hypothetical protein